MIQIGDICIGIGAGSISRVSVISINKYVGVCEVLASTYKGLIGTRIMILPDSLRRENPTDKTKISKKIIKLKDLV